jgi:hypothetical protein
VVPLTVAGLAGLATALGLADGLDVATFVVVVYTAIFSAVAVLGWRPFAAMPELDVALYMGVETKQSVQLPQRSRAEIDIDACLNERIQAARATVPLLASAEFDPMVEGYHTALG